eukprot:gene2303-33_t
MSKNSKPNSRNSTTKHDPRNCPTCVNLRKNKILPSRHSRNKGLHTSLPSEKIPRKHRRQARQAKPKFWHKAVFNGARYHTAPPTLSALERPELQADPFLSGMERQLLKKQGMSTTPIPTAINWANQKETNLAILQGDTDKHPTLCRKIHEVLRNFHKTKLQPDAIDTQKGLIYAVIHPTESAMYVGQTSNTCLHRLRQHQKDRHTRDCTFHRVLHDAGAEAQNFYMIPIEVIPPTLYKRESNEATENAFKAIATEYEHKWIGRLRTYAPIGWNDYSHFRPRKVRRQPRPHRRIRTQHAKITPPMIPFTMTEDNIYVADSGPNERHRNKLKEILLTTTNEEINNILTPMKIEHVRAHKQWLVTNLPKDQKPPAILDNILEAYKIRLSARDLTRQATPQYTPPTQRLNLDIARIIRDPKHKHPDPQQLANTRVVFSQAPPIKIQICNYTDVSFTALDAEQRLPADQCNCRHYRTEGAILSADGHLHTMDYNAVKDTQLREWFQHGAKFCPDQDPTRIPDEIEGSLKQYLQTNATEENKEQFKKYTDSVLTDIIKALDHHLKPDDKGEQLYRPARQELKKLQEHFVIHQADKAAHNLVMTCKPLYANSLRDELNSDAYQSTQQTAKEILNKIKTWNRKHKLQHADILGYMYAVCKMHKEPHPTNRFLVGASKKSRNFAEEKEGEEKKIFPPGPATTATTAASKKISKLLKTIIRILREKDEENFLKTGIRRCHIADDVTDAAFPIKCDAHYDKALPGRRPYTHDFTTMYTCLPQDLLITNLTTVINEACDYWKTKNRATNDASAPPSDTVFFQKDASLSNNPTMDTPEELEELINS